MIPGLRYVPGYLDAAAHDALLAAVDAGPWREFGERRAQIYGYSYHYFEGRVYRVEDLPGWAQDLAARFERDGLMPELCRSADRERVRARSGHPRARRCARSSPTRSSRSALARAA